MSRILGFSLLYMFVYLCYIIFDYTLIDLIALVGVILYAWFRVSYLE